MKKIKLVISLLLSLSVTSFISNAATVSSVKISLENTRFQIITGEYWPRLYILDVEGLEAVGCDVNNAFAISLGSANPQGEMMLKMLQDAQKEGKEVSLSSKACWGGYSVPEIFSIVVYPN